MATLDQLNFEVIISDKKFDAQIKAVEEKARRFNTSMSNLLNIRRISTQMSQADVENARRLQQARVDEARAQERINREHIRTEGLQRRINAQVERTTRSYTQQSRILQELKGLALGYLSIHGAQQLLSSLIRVTGEFELQKTTLSAMLGDLNAAEDIITRIQGLAVESPFQFKELTTYAKQLSAFSVPAQELYDTTKMLADVSAGLGVGMDRIVLAYGQVKSAAFLRGQEVRQFTEAGIPILNELAKQFSELEGRAVSTSEVFDKISKRLVPFEMVAKVFKDMTSEGGKFYKMQEIQAETLRGKISNLKDAYEVMLNEIGKGQSENLKGAVDWVRKLMQNYEDTGRAIVELVAAYGVYQVALIALTAATGTFTLANHKLLNALSNAAKWATKNPYVILAAGLAAIGYAVYKNITALEPYEKIMNSLQKTNDKFVNSMSAETAKLNALYAKLELAKEGTEAYADAKRQIYSQYASYISELENEGMAVDNLANIYDKLKLKIIESQKARFREMATQNLDQNYEEQTSALLEESEKATERLLKKTAFQFSALEKEAIQAYVAGTLSMSEIEGDQRLKGLASILNNAAESGNRAWQQFGTSIEHARAEFELASAAYAEGLKVIDEIYGKAENKASKGLNPFVYDLESGGGGKSPAQKAIEEQIKSVQKLQDAYEKLMPFLNEEQMKSTLKNLFPNIGVGIIDSLDFDAELERLANELAKFDEDAAQRLRDTIGKDVAGAIADSFRAVEEYKKMLDSWLGEDFNLSGKGVSFDISKIISNLNTEYAKIDQKRERALDLLNKAQMGDEIALAKLRESLGEKVWQEYVVKGSKAIDTLAIKEKAAVSKVAEERIRDLAQKFVNEKMSQNNIDLSDLDDKTLGQIRVQMERLKALYGEVDKEIQKMGDVEPGTLDSVGQAKLDMLKSALEMLGIKIKDLEVDVEEKIIDKFRDAADAVADMGGKISELGEALGNSKLADYAKEMGEVAKGVSSIAEAAQAKDTISLIANVASLLIGKITSIITSATENQQRLNEATREYAELLNEARRNAYTGIFGTDEMAKAEENYKILMELQKKYEDSLYAFENEKKIRNRTWVEGGSISFKKESVSDVLGDLAGMQGWDLYGENGKVNMEAIIAYYDAYAEYLTKRQRSMVDELIATYNEQNDAASASAEYMTSIFSSTADTIAEKMVDAFIESGDAATDLKDVVSDVASQMATDLIKTLYVMPILNDYAKQLEQIATDSSLGADEKTARALEVFQTAVSEIEGNKDAINETLAELEQYFQKGDDGDTGVGEGIRGITEDQANLLASYLNAIRADVAFSKTLWVKMDKNLQRIADMLTAPTLMEYQAQIAANTANNAMYAQSIMEDLRSVMTSETGERSIRVYREN